jgi:uncharacterized oligopeptide transporter (OPT) family protein
MLGTPHLCARWPGRRSAKQAAQAAALSVGAIVCIAAATRALRRDLKTGFIVGATPLYQQIGLVTACSCRCR